MTEWCQVILYFLTSKIRIILGLYLVVKLLNFPEIDKRTYRLSNVGALFITVFTMLALPHICIAAVEIGILLGITYYVFRKETRMCIFLIFFYEIAIALWEFLISAGIGILLKNKSFIVNTTTEYMLVELFVLLLMAGVLLLVNRRKNFTHKDATRLASTIAIMGMFGVILLSEQQIIPINDSELTTWIILSLLLMIAVLFFNLNRQYEIERDNVRLKEEHAEMLERDYRALNKTYIANSKLYHDIHNHIEVMHRYLEQGKTDDAIQYLEDLRIPVQEITQTVWTGDEAIDYLVNSKITFAEQQHIHTNLNIEFPRNTNIRSVDLTAILGNLLDNALEAAVAAKGDFRFINLTIRRIHNMLIIKIENGFAEKPVVVDGELQTLKTDKSMHGWGLKSIISAAEKYDGVVETSYSDHTFQAVVTLSYEAVE